MSSNDNSSLIFLFYNYFTIFISLLLLIRPCNCEWTSGGMASTFPHHDETSESYTMAYINVTYRDPISNKLYSEKSENAKFGGAYIYPAKGVLIHITSARGDHTGCSLPFKNTFHVGNNNNLPNEPWIALVKRGGCNFQVKVDNAFRSNASGIIVYNDRDKAVLEKMKLSPMDLNSNMSAVFTYKWKGEELAHLLDNGTRIYAHVTIASHCTRPYNTINSGTVALLRKSGPIINAICGTSMVLHQCAMLTSVLFVSISFIVLMIISLAWLVFYYVQRFRYIHAKDRLSRRLCTAAKKALSKIPTKHIKAEDKGDGECCAICIEPYKTSEVVRILPCKHEFHRSCIDPWLLEHRTCPMCKMDILKHYGFVFNRPALRLVSMVSDSLRQVVVEQSPRLQPTAYLSLAENYNNHLLSIVTHTEFTGSQESILHMDIEEAVSDTDSVHHPSLSPVPHVHNIQSGIGLTRSLTPDFLSRSSRASTPDEYSPALPPSLSHPSHEANQGNINSLSPNHFISAKNNSQMRRSVSLDNCDLPSTSQ
ncbi:ring finger protein goliath isoform X2 [Lycorma delicatula]|uniref:ring finger protein goliath isoform X2 n=1 Tax=Lycorma delicatula TaxID=130591 RepID=UPI003F519D8D